MCASTARRLFGASTNLENLMKLLLVTALVLTSLAAVPAHAGDKPRQCGLFLDFACKEDHYCRSLGTLPGQPAYIQCRLIVSEQRQRNWNLALDRLHAQLAPPHRCSGTVFGNTWDATCW
jgi:hypothetical protein